MLLYKKPPVEGVTWRGLGPLESSIPSIHTNSTTTSSLVFQHLKGATVITTGVTTESLQKYYSKG